MALPASGPISFNDINVELGVSGTTQASLGQTSYRTLAGVPSGQISMSNFYGKANQFEFTISSNQTNANLASLATAAGWNGSSKVVATIGTGIYVSSNSTGTPALTINGSFPNGVELTNNGLIVGMGGAGGAGGSYAGAGGAGSSGGLALSVSVALTLRNNGLIGGGGGGGGGGGSGSGDYGAYAGGGGGGGRSGASGDSAGGARGLSTNANNYGTAGNPGTVNNAGSGGGGAFNDAQAAGFGGTGGDRGAAGATGGRSYYGTASLGGPGGGGGGAISGNSNITYLATGTRYGSIT